MRFHVPFYWLFHFTKRLHENKLQFEIRLMCCLDGAGSKVGKYIRLPYLFRWWKHIPVWRTSHESTKTFKRDEFLFGRAFGIFTSRMRAFKAASYLLWECFWHHKVFEKNNSLSFQTFPQDYLFIRSRITLRKKCEEKWNGICLQEVLCFDFATSHIASRKTRLFRTRLTFQYFSFVMNVAEVWGFTARMSNN